MRIAQVANFVTETSGGLRTTLNHLAAGYAAHGHEVMQVLPGASDEARDTAWGAQSFLTAPALTGTGYRVLVQPRRVEHVLEQFQPDVLEVHDRTTLRGLGRWARARDVRSLVVSHERLDRWLRQWLPRTLPLQQTADWSNRALVANFDVVVCTTSWAAQEFARLGATNLRVIPLGVDLDAFVPRLDAENRTDEIRLIHVGRLSKEKRPELAVEAVRELVRRRQLVQLVVCGDGPMRGRLHRLSEGLPIEWRGFVANRYDLADCMRWADIAIAPGPIETFGLAALEAMACGTPVVVNRRSALPEIVGDGGRVAPHSAWCFADVVLDLMSVDEVQRRRAARLRAEIFDWEQTVQGFLELHGRADLQLAS